MCTDVLIVSKTSNGRDLVVNARSQEFATALGYRMILRKKGVKVLVTQPRRQSLATPIKKILAHPLLVDLCVSKYDYIGVMITTLDVPPIPVSTAAFDGMNSAGLSVSGLNAPGSKYQPKSDSPSTNNVFVGFFTDWLMTRN